MRRQKGKVDKRAPERGALSELTGVSRGDIPYIEMLGNGEAVIDGYKGVLEYTAEAISLNAGSCVIRFCGNNMTIKAYSESQTEIYGDIQSVEFTR